MATAATKEFAFEWEGRDRNAKQVRGETRAAGENQVMAALMAYHMQGESGASRVARRRSMLQVQSNVSSQPFEEIGEETHVRSGATRTLRMPLMLAVTRCHAAVSASSCRVPAGVMR